MGFIHYIEPDNKIRTVKADRAPSAKEIREFIGGKELYQPVWPNRKYQWLAKKLDVQEDDRVNVYASLLVQELTKYQNGFKRIAEDGTGEEPITCIEALAYCELMLPGPLVKGKAIYFEDLKPTMLEGA